MLSIMVILSMRKPGRRVGGGGNFCGPLEQQVRQEAAGAERSGNAQALMSSGQPNPVREQAAADQGQLVRCGSAMAGPYAGAGKLAQRGHVLESAIEHAIENRLVHLGILGVELARG